MAELLNYKIVRRTFEAKKYPKNSPERTRLNKDNITSEYLPSYKYVVQRIQGSELQVNLIGAVMAYILLATGIVFFVLPKIDTRDTKTMIRDSFLYGGLFGIVLYGVFDFTNMAMFKNWSLNISVIDTIWGFLLVSITAFLVSWILTKFN